jgi:hypothetical protein
MIDRFVKVVEHARIVHADVDGIAGLRPVRRTAAASLASQSDLSSVFPFGGANPVESEGRG